MRDITYTRLAEYRELSSTNTTIKKVCLVSWNGAAPVLDIRGWSVDGVRAFKGCTLNRAEAELLRDTLNSIDFDRDFDETK